jgi:hypothetical protein
MINAALGVVAGTLPMAIYIHRLFESFQTPGYNATEEDQLSRYGAQTAGNLSRSVNMGSHVLSSIDPIPLTTQPGQHR